MLYVSLLGLLAFFYVLISLVASDPTRPGIAQPIPVKVSGSCVGGRKSQEKLAMLRLQSASTISFVAK